MPKYKEKVDDIFNNSPREDFLLSSIDFKNRLSFIPNPYIGNKRKMIFDIGIFLYDSIGKFDGIKICDLFAGSSVVSAYFKNIGCQVDNNDLLSFSYLNAICLLRDPSISLSDSEWIFLTSNKNKNKRSFVFENYNNVRFEEKECEFIDNFYANCQEMFGRIILDNGDIGIDNEVSLTKAALAHVSLIHFIMIYCFVGGRLNNGQILAALQHRIEHQRSKNSSMPFNKMKQFDFSVNGPKANVYHLDVFDFLDRKKDYDLVYIDPPYGGQQSDYAFMYQFFEEYIMQTDYKNIKYLQNKSEKFCKSKNYEESFIELLKKLPETKWLISYNNSSWANVEKIKEILGKFKENISIKEIDYSYKYRSSEDNEGKEYLILGQ